MKEAQPLNQGPPVTEWWRERKQRHHREEASTVCGKAEGASGGEEVGKGVRGQTDNKRDERSEVDGREGEPEKQTSTSRR